MQSNMKALICGHIYCKYCADQLPFQIDGPVPVYYCDKCNKWTVILILCKF